MDRIGRYKVVRELGRGAMGVVYHAIDPNIGRPVAIKTIQLGSSGKPDERDRLRERLFREARSAGSLSHPGIVTIYDVEQEGELAYIAMEYVDGPTLDQLLAEGQIQPDRMFSILGQTSTALDYAHQKGIVHRDIKPANIMIAADGTAKITDFGIAKITASEQLTMTGTIVGTPHYMSPEQVQGQPVDGRSDQFSLAVIAFEMLTGEKPYTGEHLTTVVYKIVAEEPVPPHRINSTLSGAIENALRKGLAKKPDARYRNCQEFAEALEKACAVSKGWKTMARGDSLNEPTMAVGKPALPAARSARRGTGTGTVERAQRRKSGFLPFLFAVLTAAALLALIGWQAAPWLTPKQQPATQGKSNNSAAEAPKPAAPADENKPSPMPAPPVEQPKQADEKPVGDEPITKPAQPPAPRPAAAPQQVMIISSPGGAKAMLDSNSNAACTTPCSLDAAPGRHSVAVTMPGYQIERREVDVGSAAVEMPAIILRAQSGTLMLTSTPPGASIAVNGKPVTETTPAQLPLAPGTYKVTVEKDGKQSTSTVDIRNGEIRTLKVLLGQ